MIARAGVVPDPTVPAARPCEPQTRPALAVPPSKVGRWDWNLLTNEIEFSAEYKRQIGYEPDEIPNRFEEFYSRLHPDDVDRCVTQIEAFIADPWEDYQLEFRFRHRDGSYRWISACALLERDAHGRAVRMFGTHVDVTGRSNLEAALAAAGRNHETLVERATSDAVFVNGPDGRLVDVNGHACRMLGYTRGELLQLAVADLVVDDALRTACAQWADLTVGGSRSIDGQLRRKDGGTLPVEATMGPLELAGRRLCVVFCRDISERIDAERARKATRAKTDFIAAMSHELRTPLNAIVGFSDVLRLGMAGELGDEQRRMLDDIHAAGKHLHALINDVLDLAKVEAGKTELELESHDVRGLLESAVRILRDRAARRNIPLQVRCEPAVGAALIDGRKVKQVVLNLLSNALKFSRPDQPVVLRAALKDAGEIERGTSRPARRVGSLAGGVQRWLEVAVRDRGPGLTPDQMAQLFEPFVQIKGIAAHEVEGTGLGLALVRQIAELHGGNVGVASRVGEGSEFVVWLPWLAADAGDVAGAA